MDTVRVINRTRDTLLGERVDVARTLWSRGRGLMLRDRLPPGGGLLIEPCSSIHTMWMRFPIDVIYVGADGIVVRVDSAMRPWRLGPVFTGARYVIELPAGTAARASTQAGDEIALIPVSA